MKSPWYTTINGAVIGIRLVALFILLFLASNCFIGSRCKVQDVGLHIAFFCVLPVAVSMFINPIRRCLAIHFPISCGHRRCVFTGESSRTLKAILLDTDQDIPSVEQLRRFQNQASIFLDDVKDELEKGITTATFECIFTGSVVERFGIPTCHARGDMFSALDTSFDIMFCPEADNASFSGQKGNVCVELIPEGDGYSTYAQLRPIRPRFEGDLVSSRNIRRNASSAINGTKTVTHLPELPKTWYGRCTFRPRVKISSSRFTNKINVGNVYHVRFMICIKCREWPPHSDWPTRPRCWPSQEDVTRIVSHGCHLVAKPAPSDKEETSWRFSFSVAEVELSKLVPNTARKCLLALKIILKDHLQPVVAEITSYDLKTIFLNTLEKTEVDFWVDENIEECFLLLMKEFHDALVCGNCPHHWFESVNLFTQLKERHPKQIAALIRKIKMVVENPAPFIFDDGCCCLYPCCTRKRLYDFQGTRLSNLDRSDDEMPIYVELVNEQVGNSNDALEPASHAVSVESIREHDPGHPSTSLESVDHKKGTSEEAVIIKVQPDDAGDEVPMRVELVNEQVGNSNHAFEPASHAVSVDSIREHDPGHPSTSLESGC